MAVDTFLRICQKCPSVKKAFHLTALKELLYIVTVFSKFAMLMFTSLFPADLAGSKVRRSLWPSRRRRRHLLLRRCQTISVKISQSWSICKSALSLKQLGDLAALDFGHIFCWGSYPA